jgi:hypothetical protein
MSFIPQGTEKKSCKNAAIGKALEINDRENKNSRDFKNFLLSTDKTNADLSGACWFQSTFSAALLWGVPVPTSQHDDTTAV